jgi:hypothetical protein
MDSAIIVCQSRVTDCNKYSILVWEIDDGKSHGGVGVGVGQGKYGKSPHPLKQMGGLSSPGVLGQELSTVRELVM